IGSLSEFVSFSQHPTDPGILLGGLQDNGSPALNNGGGSGTTWQGTNISDGGYNAIDPNSPSTFYTSFFDVSVQRCASGTSCVNGTWTSVINPNTVSSDGSSFYPPFILDPGASGRMLFGTCRLWRGNAAGGSFLSI